MTTINNNDLNSSLNIGYVEIERLLNQNNLSRSKQPLADVGRSSKRSSNNDLFQVNKSSKNKALDNERLKQVLRNSNWSPVHPIRKNLWTNLLQLNSENITNKENKNNISTETEYSRYLNQIFGKSKLMKPFFFSFLEN